jgi:hypothetical protein
VPTDPLTASRIPAGSDSPNIAQFFNNAVFDLADDTIPTFATETARNTAYTSWVTAGGAMRDGLRCYITGLDTFQVYESGAWRFWKYAGPISSANTPAAHITRSGQVIGVAVATTISGWTVDRSHPYVTVNANGTVTINQRGVWAVFGRFYSDYSAAGVSAVSFVISGTAYPQENTVPRDTGYAGAGGVRQPLAWTGYVEAGSTVTASVFQNNTAAANVAYDARFTLHLIG